VFSNPSPEDGNRSNFRNIVFIRFSNDGQVQAPTNPYCLGNLGKHGHIIKNKTYRYVVEWIYLPQDKKERQINVMIQIKYFVFWDGTWYAVTEV
jgi:hypothetical protein